MKNENFHDKDLNEKINDDVWIRHYALAPGMTQYIECILRDFLSLDRAKYVGTMFNYQDMSIHVFMLLCHMDRVLEEDRLISWDAHFELTYVIQTIGAFAAAHHLNDLHSRCSDAKRVLNCLGRHMIPTFTVQNA